MKNLIPAILSTVISFAATTYALNTYVKVDDKKTEVTSKKEKPTKQQEEASTPKKSEETTSKSSDNIQGSYASWEAYTKENIDLMSTFNALDDKGAEIKKNIFLALLRSGSYTPMKNEIDGKQYYQLVNLEENADPKIKKTIISNASLAYSYFKMEGKKLPDYDFVDLKGKAHNKKDTRGKILVLKCWFITCKVCVEEFPELNALVDKYKGEKIEFVSLAFDEKDKLIEFLKTKPFKFSTIPLQRDYMSKKLKVKQYPSHLIVDANGRIIKMVNSVKTLTSELERIMGK